MNLVRSLMKGDGSGLWGGKVYQLLGLSPLEVDTPQTSMQRPLEAPSSGRKMKSNVSQVFE